MQTNNLIHFPSSNGAQAQLLGLQRALQEMTDTVSLWVKRMRERHELRSLLDNDERFFSDIGVFRATIHTESEKWFWQE